MTQTDALRIIDAELREWGKSLDQLPRSMTLGQMLRIVGAE